MCADIWMLGEGRPMSKRIDLQHTTYRLIPSHFPPIHLFENLLDPKELDAAYALESLTNDRLQDEVGRIALVAAEDRITGPGTTAIMAAFTHIGAQSRFTDGSFGIYYAGLDLETAMAESKASRSRFLQATNEGAQVLTMRCYSCDLQATLVDVRRDLLTQDPDNYAYPQQIGRQLKAQNEMGVLYKSVRHPNGECIGALKPTALIPPAVQTEHYQFIWDGRVISHVLSVTEV